MSENAFTAIKVFLIILGVCIWTINTSPNTTTTTLVAKNTPANYQPQTYYQTIILR